MVGAYGPCILTAGEVEGGYTRGVIGDGLGSGREEEEEASVEVGEREGTCGVREGIGGIDEVEVETL